MAQRRFDLSDSDSLRRLRDRLAFPANITAILILAAVGAYVAMGEVDRLIRQSVGGGTISYSLNELSGLQPFGWVDAWTAWTADVDDNIAPALIGTHLVLDLVFIAAYGLLLLGRFRMSRVWPVVVLVLIAADLAEDVLILLATCGVPVGPAIPWVTLFAKWGAVLLLFLVLLASPGKRQEAWRTLRGVAQAVWYHRLAAILVLLLAVVTLVPTAGVLDQLADAQRDWVDTDAGYGWHPWVALVLVLVLAAAGFVLGSQRTAQQAERYRKLGEANRTAWMRAREIETFYAEKGRDRFGYLWSDDPRDPAVVPLELPARFTADSAPALTGSGTPVEDAPRPGYLLWAAPGILAIITMVVLLFVNADRIDWWPFGVFVGGLAALLVASAIIAARQREEENRIGNSPPDEPVKGVYDPDAIDPEAAVDRLRRTGNVVAFLVIAVGGLGLIRTFSAPVALIIGGRADELEIPIADSIGWVVLGAFSAFVLFPELLRRNWKRPVDPVDIADPTRLPDTGGRERVARLLLILAGALMIAAVVFFPLPVTEALGVAGTMLAVLLAWSMILGAATVELAGRNPLPVFWRIGLASDPVLAVAVVIPLLIALLVPNTHLHAVERRETADALQPRQTISDALGEWVDGSSDACVIHPAPGVNVRPLVIAATQGGGIRAATWTADVYREFAEAGPCGQNAVFLSSGVSGGSLGLTLFRTDDPASQVNAAATGSSIAGPRTLSAILGTALTSDVLAGATGLRVPTFPGDNSGSGWHDRAGWAQAVWRSSANAFSYDYDHERQAPTGWLILNSTAAKLNCRVLVSQLDLGLPSVELQADGGPVGCESPQPGVAGAIDLETAYGECPVKWDWATAALLSARFGVVSPDGYIDPANLPDTEACRKVPRLQLVDGGYAENSGLATLTDLSPLILSEVAYRNELTAHSADDAADKVYVVPIVMWVSNEPGSDLTDAPAQPSASLTVPLDALDSKIDVSASSRWLQRLSEEVGLNRLDGESPLPETTAFCPTDPALAKDCVAAVSAVQACVPNSLVVIAPLSVPTISAPLGWTLSKMSDDGLGNSLVHALRPGSDGSCDPTLDKNRYAHLSELLNLISP